MTDSKLNPSSNPANVAEKGVLPPGYVPMGAPVQKLQVPEREGYHRRWIRGDAGRIQKAMRAGYQFVAPDDVNLNNFGLGGDASTSGNTDMGSSRVSVISGDKTDATGQPGRLYLMECPIDLYERSRQTMREINEDVADALKGGRIGSESDGASDKSARYVDKKKTAMPNLFTAKD